MGFSAFQESAKNPSLFHQMLQQSDTTGFRYQLSAIFFNIRRYQRLSILKIYGDVISSSALEARIAFFSVLFSGFRLMFYSAKRLMIVRQRDKTLCKAMSRSKMYALNEIYCRSCEKSGMEKYKDVAHSAKQAWGK